MTLTIVENLLDNLYYIGYGYRYFISMSQRVLSESIFNIKTLISKNSN